jgi:hypothetical protein
VLIPETNQLTEDIIKACECLKAWWRKELIQQQKDLGGSELCGSEVNNFSSRVSSNAIGNGNGNSNTSTARAKFVHNGVITTHFTATPAPYPNPEIYTAITARWSRPSGAY